MGRQANNIGFLRLVLASLVIVGHSAEMIDGNRHREPLTVIFHTLSLGGIAVDGFFLISGYLITKSMLESPTTLSYLSRRVWRIYPAFIVASLVSVLLLAPYFGGHVTSAPRTFVRIALLQTPHESLGRLAELPYPALNGSMWTISYEFRCYLLIAVLGVAGLLKRRRVMVALTVLTSAAAVAETFAGVHGWSDDFDARWRLQAAIGSMAPTLQLTATFLIGSCFYTFRDMLISRLNGRMALFSTAVLIVALFNAHLAELAMAVVGGFGLFWLAFRANLGPLQRINDRWDISYGVYLYGWPIATMILWNDRTISPWLLTAFTLPLSCLVGAASWWGLERWTKDIGRPSRLSSARADAGSERTVIYADGGPSLTDPGS